MDESEIRENEEISEVIIISDDENVETNEKLSTWKKIKIETESNDEESNDVMEFINIIDSDEDSFLQSKKEKKTAEIISEIVNKFKLARAKAISFSNKQVASQLTPQKELDILNENNLLNFNSFDTQKLLVNDPARSSTSSIKSPFILNIEKETNLFPNVCPIELNTSAILDTETKTGNSSNSQVYLHNLTKSVLKIEENKAKSSVNFPLKISANSPLEVFPYKLPTSFNCKKEDKKSISLIYPPAIPATQLTTTRKSKKEENREKCAKYPAKISLIPPQKTQIKIVTPPKLRIQENKSNFPPNFVSNPFPIQLTEPLNFCEKKNETKFSDNISPNMTPQKINTPKMNVQENKVKNANSLPPKKRHIQQNATKFPAPERKETKFKTAGKMSMQNTDFNFNGTPKVSQIQLIALHNLETAEKEIKSRANYLNKTQSKNKKLAIEKNRQKAAAIRAKKSEDKSIKSKDKKLYKKCIRNEDKQIIPAVSILKVNKQDSRRRFADSTNQKFLSLLIEDLLFANIKFKHPLLFQYEDSEFRYVNVFGTIVGVHTTIEKLQILVEDTTGRVTCILENKSSVNKLNLNDESESKKARYSNPKIKKPELLNIVKKEDAQFIQNLEPNITSNFIETYTDIMVKKSKSLLIDDYPSRENLGFSENPVGKHVSVTGKPFDRTNERIIYVWDIKFISLDEFMMNLEVLVKKRHSKDVVSKF